jgi:hypothetical protein
MKHKHTGILAIMILVVFGCLVVYYKNISVHNHILLTDVLEIETFGLKHGSKVVSDKEQERIVKAFNSIKSIRRQDKNSLSAGKIARIIIIELKTGGTIKIYSGYVVGMGLMIETPDYLYSGRNTELENLLKSL